ncbi:MAG TPA: hypothetical protein VFK40_11585 [Nitrososphaeraceae archaeon]|nr:hypothetical protein [Nitrososphaeraceae archaeon]
MNSDKGKFILDFSYFVKYGFFFLESINNPPKKINMPKADVSANPYSYEYAEIPKNCVSG